MAAYVYIALITSVKVKDENVQKNKGAKAHKA